MIITDNQAQPSFCIHLLIFALQLSKYMCSAAYSPPFREINNNIVKYHTKVCSITFIRTSSRPSYDGKVTHDEKEHSDWFPERYEFCNMDC